MAPKIGGLFVKHDSMQIWRWQCRMVYVMSTTPCCVVYYVRIGKRWKERTVSSSIVGDHITGFRLC
jgi:hypothetical protein